MIDWGIVCLDFFFRHIRMNGLHTLDLSDNQIGDATQQLLKKEYPHINWSF
jgi:hypothetical protein